MKCTLCDVVKMDWSAPELSLTHSVQCLPFTCQLLTSQPGLFFSFLTCRRGWFPASYTKLLEEDAKEAMSVPTPR